MKKIISFSILPVSMLPVLNIIALSIRNIVTLSIRNIIVLSVRNTVTLSVRKIIALSIRNIITLSVRKIIPLSIRNISPLSIRNVIPLPVLAAAALLLSSCEKDLPTFSDEARLYFFERGTDVNQTRLTSKSFSFISLPSSVLKDTFLIRVKIMGDTTGYDRTVRGIAGSQGTTAIEGTDYDFIDGTVPHGAVIGYLPVVLYRTEKIKGTELSLKIKIAATKDFQPGVVEDSSFTLTWSDNLIKPSNWDQGPSYFFGAYSAVKYRFIIDVLGVYEFPQATRFGVNPGEYSAAAMTDFKNRLKEALAAYNATHPELTDENGLPVTFPA